MKRAHVLVLYALVVESAEDFAASRRVLPKRRRKVLRPVARARWTVRLLAEYCAARGLPVSNDFVHKALLLWGARGCVLFEASSGRTWEAVHDGIRRYLRAGHDKDPDSGDLYRKIGEALDADFWEQFIGLRVGRG